MSTFKNLSLKCFIEFDECKAFSNCAEVWKAYFLKKNTMYVHYRILTTKIFQKVYGNGIKSRNLLCSPRNFDGKCILSNTMYKFPKVLYQNNLYFSMFPWNPWSLLVKYSEVKCFNTLTEHTHTFIHT